MKDSQSLKKKINKFIKKKAKPAPAQQTLPVPTPTEQSPHETWIHALTHHILGIISLVLLVIFLALTVINNQLLQEIIRNTVVASDITADIAPYPKIMQPYLFDLSAKTAVVLDTDAQAVLFSKNPELRFSTASTAKIMTALVALDYFAPTSILTIKTAEVEGSKLGFLPGEQFTFESLLKAMMLPSANDAAVAIADNYPGGQKAFVTKMNEKAATLHLENTHFVDPIGIEDDGDYTTALDLARLGGIGMQNPVFAQVVGTRETSISNIRQTRFFPLSNLNKLLGFNGVNGIKTGTTTGAGEVLVTSANNNGHNVVIVVLNSTQRFVDTQVLLNFVSQNVVYVTVPGFPQQ